MMLSKEDVLKFCIDTGIRVGQQNIKHCKISQMYAKLSLLMCFYWGGTFICMRGCKIFWRQRVSISTLQNRNHSRKLCEHIRESTRTLNMTVLEIFHLYAHQNFSSVCKTAKYRKTRRILPKHYESHKHSRIRAKTYPKSARTINYTIVEFPLHVRLLEGSK